MLTPEERSLRAQIAANARWSMHDPEAAMAKVREGLWRKWLDQVDPDRTLSEEERFRRAECARKAHYQRMNLASIRARKKTG